MEFELWELMPKIKVEDLKLKDMNVMSGWDSMYADWLPAPDSLLLPPPAEIMRELKEEESWDEADDEEEEGKELAVVLKLPKRLEKEWRAVVGEAGEEDKDEKEEEEEEEGELDEEMVDIPSEESGSDFAPDADDDDEDSD